MNKRTLSIVVTLITLLISFGISSYFVINLREPQCLYKFKLDDIPQNIVVGKKSELFFLNENGLLNSVKIINNELIQKNIAEDVAQICAERDYIAIVDNNNRFMFINANDASNKNFFADEINRKGSKCIIKKIISGDNFTAVLFSDGTLYSDINYQDNDASAKQDDYLIFSEYEIKDVSVAEYQILALDNNNTVHSYTLIPGKYNQEVTISVSYEVNSICAGLNKSYILSKNGDVFSFDNSQVLDEHPIIPTKVENLSNIETINVGYSDWVTLACSNDGELYHWGLGYDHNSTTKSICEIVMPKKVFESNEIAHFVGTGYGILIIEDDGSLKILNN